MALIPFPSHSPITHPMPLVFVYGTLKQGFVNEHVNAGARVPGAYRTLERMPLLLLGTGHVPCLVCAPGQGHQVVGELYQVDAQTLAAMDRLERMGEPGGYQRVAISLERTDRATPEAISAMVYVKLPVDVPEDTARVGPLAEYTAEHARHFRW